MPKPYSTNFCRYHLTRNSSGDEIANVNFLYDDIVRALETTIDYCIDSATGRFLQRPLEPLSATSENVNSNSCTHSRICFGRTNNVTCKRIIMWRWHRFTCERGRASDVMMWRATVRSHFVKTTTYSECSRVEEDNLQYLSDILLIHLLRPMTSQSAGMVFSTRYVWN